MSGVWVELGLPRDLCKFQTLVSVNVTSCAIRVLADVIKLRGGQTDLGWVLSQYHGPLYKKRLGHRQAQREDGHVMMVANIEVPGATNQGMPGTTEAGRCQQGAAPEPQREPGPVDILMWDPHLQDCEKTSLVCRVVLWRDLVRKPQEMSTNMNHLV